MKDRRASHRGPLSEKLVTWGVVALPLFCALFQGGFPLWAGLTVAAAAWLLLGAAVGLSFWRGSLPFVWHREDAVLFLVLAWAGLGLFPGPGEAVEGFLVVLGGVPVFLLARLLSQHGAGRRIARRLVVAGGAIALAGFLQMLGVLPHDWWDPARYPAGPFINHNHFAAFLNLLLTLAGGVLFSTRPKSRQRFVVLISILAMAVGWVISGSRGAWLSLLSAAVILLLLWVARRRVSWNWVHVLAVLAVFGGVWFLAGKTRALDRALTLGSLSEDQSAGSRSAIWSGTLRLVRDRPFIGSGLGSFVHLFPRYRPPGFYMQANHAHNDYMEMAAELGLAGLGLAVWAAVLLLRRGFRMAELTASPWKRSLGWGCMAGLIAVVLHGFVDYPWRVPGVFYLAAVVAGLLAGLRYRADPDPLWEMRPPAKRAGWKGLRMAVSVWAAVVTLGAAGAASWSLAADMQFRRGTAMEELHRREEAASYYGKALRWAPWRTDVLRRLADLWIRRSEEMDGYERRESQGKAVEAYQRLLRRVPYDSAGMHGLSEALRRMGRVDEAVGWMDQAVRGDPNNPVFWKHWAELKVIHGETREGARGFARAGALSAPYGFFPSIFGDLSDPAAWVERGGVALLRGQLSVAESYFEVAREMAPGSSEPEAGLALCALYRGAEGPALDRAARLQPASAPARALWFSGQSYFFWKRERWREAEEAARTALELDPRNLLAAQMVSLLADRQGADPAAAAESVIRSNLSPVFARKSPDGHISAVWEPEKGTYPEGSRISTGWALYSKGAIRERIRLPVGKVRIEAVASGTKARGMGPRMTVSWNGVPVFSAEVGEVWAGYGAQVQIGPGESWLSVEFMNDSTDPLSREDRNLKVDKVILRWEGPS